LALFFGQTGKDFLWLMLPDCTVQTAKKRAGELPDWQFPSALGVFGQSQIKAAQFLYFKNDSP